MFKNTTLPAALPIGDALARSEPLARIRALIRASTANFEAVKPLMPASLQANARPGPLDEEGWTILVDNSAAAAKLRQLLPRFEAVLLQRDGQRSLIRVRVQSGRTA